MNGGDWTHARRAVKRGTRIFVLVGLAALAGSRPAPAASGGDAAAARRAYYAVRYPGEQGPFKRRQQAVDAAVLALSARARSEEWWTEWLALIFHDRYGKWWHSLPKEGRVVSVGQCAVSYSAREIRRPGSTLVSTAHTHPRGDLFPDPRPDSPDNRNAQEMFLLRSDGGVWFFKPHDRRGSLYGRVLEGALERADSGAAEARRRGNRDGEAVGLEEPGKPARLATEH